MNPLVELAHKAITAYIKEKKIINPPENPTDEMKGRAGVFVCLKKNGDLRGCIGTFSPTTENIAQETIHNAIESATRDPRFPEVKPDELASLDITVDLLTDPLKVASIKELDAKRFGIIVKSGMKRGLLLPDLEGVETPEQQIAIAKRKAWIADEEPIEVYKFEVRRYKENEK
ncbi:MAG TPA: AmmeMemoRadiSam system protein A [Candidatus Omnitrophota bacterium]|nr:AmmeMemoRadiSam system protein A [Candidatus Omnitrophota bacterium]